MAKTDMTQLQKLKESLDSFLSLKFKKDEVKKFMDISTKDGKTLSIEDGLKVEVGTAVNTKDADGNLAPAEDGDYILTDGSTITVKDGEITVLTASTANPATDSPSDNANTGDEVKANASAPADAAAQPTGTADASGLADRVGALEDKVNQIIEMLTAQSNGAGEQMKKVFAKIDELENFSGIATAKTEKIVKTGESAFSNADTEFQELKSIFDPKSAYSINKAKKSIFSADTENEMKALVKLNKGTSTKESKKDEASELADFMSKLK